MQFVFNILHIFYSTFGIVSYLIRLIVCYIISELIFIYQQYIIQYANVVLSGCFILNIYFSQNIFLFFLHNICAHTCKYLLKIANIDMLIEIIKEIAQIKYKYCFKKQNLFKKCI